MSLLAAVAAAVLFGIGTVLQATAARRSTSSANLDPRLLLRLFGQWTFLLSALAGGLGVVATAVALRHLPLFVVQATVAGSVAVSAVVAAISHREPLTPRIRLGLVGIVGGLGVLALSAGSDPPPHTSWGFRLGLVLAAVVALALAALVTRRPSRTSLGVGLLGASSGLLYGFGNVGLRVVHDFALPQVLGDPAVWAAVVGGVGGVLVLATALQRGSIALASGAVTTTETIVPAIVGLVVLGEHPRPGWGPAAAIGFVVAVAGAVVLCGDVAVAAEVRDVPDPDSAL